LGVADGDSLDVIVVNVNRKFLALVTSDLAYGRQSELLVSVDVEQVELKTS
jgi:hypothetical protein